MDVRGVTSNIFSEYEEKSSVIARVIEWVNGLRGSERARNANEKLNEMPDRKEIEIAMRDERLLSWGGLGTAAVYMRGV